MARRSSLLALVLAASGCAPALREPPPVAALGGPAVLAEGRTPDELLRLAEEGYARRPDRQGVETARELFLAAARADDHDVRGLLGAARAIAWLIEHEPDAARRAALATEAVQVCQWCVRRAPSDGACDYRLALALGHQARERPSTAADALPRMVTLLEKAIAADPLLDHAGPDRVLGLVLLRAPGWPVGPGDEEAGLEHVRRAVELVPDHPLNLLALGEALAENGRAQEAAAAYRRAEQLAEALVAAGDPDASEWLESARRQRPLSHRP